MEKKPQATEFQKGTAISNQDYLILISAASLIQ